ncbi:MAG: hypothetical protein QNJ94_11300 [Alphaproteobacteria bacterium]|nr:hypothetical protein [Alphaproteobacteria bacterium]
MKIIVIATRTAKATRDAVAPHLDEEARTALSLMADDFVREIYSRADGQGAILVLEAADEAEARERLSILPFARMGFLDLTVIPVSPYRGIVQAAKG